MAKTQRNGAAMNQVVRQGKKTVRSTVNPKTVRAAAKKARTAPQAAPQTVRPAPQQKVQVTLGDLIAAAFDVTGETKAAAKLVSSRAMSLATGTHIVVVA